MKGVKQSFINFFTVRRILWTLFIVNLLLRLLIYFNSELFYFGDYQTYLLGVDRIAVGEKIPLYLGNFVMTISYLGYFAREIMGSIDWFFIFNSLRGAISSILISLLVIKITGRVGSGIITLVLLTIYTEYMVFSSVFYTPVLMIFLLTLFIWSLLYYYSSSDRKSYLHIIPLNIIYLATLFFKPELIFLPIFLLVLVLLFRKERLLVRKGILLAGTLTGLTFLVYSSSLFSRSPGYVVSNSFVFFGHTDYGGDGGEGSFVYPENSERYRDNFSAYCYERGITEPGAKDFNDFQESEIISFVTKHPLKWIALQAKKFTRTYGVVPESNSFKILYTGLLKGNLWLTSIVVVLPVVFIIMLVIMSFNLSVMRELISNSSTAKLQNYNYKYFIYIYLLLFVYYIIATSFFGHYQERYRMPVMVCFIIPITAVFISDFDLKNYLKKPGIYIRSAITILVLVIWIFQAKAAIANKDRLGAALEQAEKSIGNK
jgi:hypothetical protein